MIDGALVMVAVAVLMMTLLLTTLLHISMSRMSVRAATRSSATYRPGGCHDD